MTMLLVIINMREQSLSGARLVSLFPPDGTLERSTDVPEMEEILGLSKDDNDDDGDKRRTMMMVVMMMTVMMVVMI